MKKILIFWTFVLLMLMNIPAVAMGISSGITVKVNGQAIQLDDNKPFMENGRIFVPIRFVGEALRANVNWDQDTQTVLINQTGVNISIPIGSTKVKINDQFKTLDAPARMVGVGTRVMVPLRFVSEVLGAEVKWNDAEQTVEIACSLPTKMSDDKIVYGNGLGYSEAQLRRAVATSAIYSKNNGLPYDSFLHIDAIISMIDGVAEGTKDGLSQWWGINSREDALRVIKWLREEGHRKEYDSLVNLISHATKEEYDQTLEQYKDDEDLINKLKFVKDHYQQTGDKSILAWDFCRLANIVQGCYIAGYITKEEAWNEIMYASKICQDNFTSWEDMANNFLLGREYWSGAADKQFTDSVNWLVANSESPWLICKWDLSLEKNSNP